MHNSESIYNKFSPISVCSGNRLTLDYEKVYKTEIGSSILLTTTGFDQHSASISIQVGYPLQTAPSPLPRVEKAAEPTGN